jgi:predicted CoA-binding protein
MPIEDADTIRKILQKARTIAVVGASVKPWRDGNSIMHFLKRKGYTVYPVNPKYREIDGEPCYPTLASIPAAIDIVDVFRQPSEVPRVVQEAIAIGAKTLWLQLGVVHEQAAEEAERAGLQVIMDRCIAVEHRQLFH